MKVTRKHRKTQKASSSTAADDERNPHPDVLRFPLFSDVYLCFFTPSFTGLSLPVLVFKNKYMLP
jgi:hypothetical protein